MIVIENQGMIPLEAVSESWERGCIDILGPLAKSKNRNEYVLVIIDYLTRFVEGFAIPNQEASTIAEVFMKEIVLRYRSPISLF